MARLLLSTLFMVMVLGSPASYARADAVNCDVAPDAPIPAATTGSPDRGNGVVHAYEIPPSPATTTPTPASTSLTPSMVPQPTPTVATASSSSTTGRTNANPTAASSPLTSSPPTFGPATASPSPSPTTAGPATPAPTAAPSASSKKIGSTGLGSCYEPMHSDLYPIHGGDSSRVGEVLDRDLQQLSSHFTVLRTYHSQFFGLRIADYARKYNLKLFVGLAKFSNPEWVETEIQAAVDGARLNPGTVEAIIVGSEDLVQAGGDQTVDAILQQVQTVKQRLLAAGVTDVLVGTAQRINELVSSSLSSEMDRLVAGCDFVGVNIYPFFTNGFDPSNPVALLDAQWTQLRSRFGSQIAKMRVTETGYPSAGNAPAAFPNNKPSPATQRAYFHAVADWKPQDMAGPHFWFMAYDRRSDDPMVRGASSYEQFFGVYTSKNEPKGVL